ncbi:hypothetical protein IPJ72_07450 [Candidatus Peregrinibacteria bacterium]|nr:MAG: hypothetical protein IPJ72_07450 [Candidatus Peregrinibacteria bacterium]
MKKESVVQLTEEQRREVKRLWGKGVTFPTPEELLKERRDRKMRIAAAKAAKEAAEKAKNE